MKFTTGAALSAITLSFASLPAFAGDIEAGESAFQSQCQNCHNVTNEEGEVLAGRPNMRTGPNLYGVIGRQPGVVDGFRYGASLVEVGESGVVWDEEVMVAYLLDPTTYLRETLDDRRARSQMSFRVRDEATARDIIAFLGQFGAVEEDEEAAEEGS
ncbi:cytochrome C [Roseinatronobacter sp.]|uniref:cytochrome C n=1 Tax=Roseinatronobacter sp. TaxID=1945755 RepID=UPI0025CBE600|nr:cytochrome C [Rhodobaca sp.]